MGVRSYLESLAWPDTVKDAVDVASKTVVAAVIAVTGFLYHHYQDEQLKTAQMKAESEAKLQRELAAVREQREDARATYGFFVTGMPDTFKSDGAIARLEIMIAFCNDAVNAKQTIVATACKHLPAEPITATQRKDAASQVATEPTAYVNSPLAQRANIATAAAEAVTPPSIGAKWFTVVGTVPLANPDTAKALAANLMRHLQDAGIPMNVVLFRTKISQSFALTIGGQMSQAEAVALAGRVRATGVVGDAFAQPNRDWSLAGI
jgi:hypothetical protein